MTTEGIVGFYARPAAMTSGGEYAALLDALPNDVGALARIAQGLALHECVASAYGVTIRSIAGARAILAGSSGCRITSSRMPVRPLTAARPPEKRLVGVCQHFMGTEPSRSDLSTARPGEHRSGSSGVL
jgi:hypothetical protein